MEKNKLDGVLYFVNVPKCNTFIIMAKYTPQQLRKMVAFLLLAFIFFMAAVYVLLNAKF